jgi:hypothetical protein
VSSPRLALLAALLAAPCALAACGEAVAPEVVLGTGEARFEPIMGEPRLPLVRGVQGGSHVWASFLAYGFSEPELNLLMTTRWVDVDGTRRVMRNPLTLRRVTDDAGEPALSFAGYPAQIDNARCAHGQRLHIELTLSDERGRQARDERFCVAEVPESDRGDNCVP